jgi:hypothetical protein
VSLKYLQTTVYGWPDKAEGREPTRMLTPFDCKGGKTYVTAIANRLGGLFRVDIAAVEEIPERDEFEITRLSEILKAIKHTKQ